MKRVLMIAIAIVVFLIAREVTKPIGSWVRQKASEPSNAEIVALTATELSKQLPSVVDEVTTLVAVKAEGETLVYEYQLDLPIAKMDEAQFRKDLEAYVVPQVCDQPEMASEIERGVSYRYSYTSSDLRAVTSITIDKAACGAR